MMSAVIRNGTEASPHDPFAGGPILRVVPTTEPQREVWLADQLGTDASLAFNESVTLLFGGHLDIDAMRRALQELVDRHDSLRSAFGPDGETFLIYEDFELPLEQRDLSALAPDVRDAALAERLRLAVETPFDLGQGRLFRAESLRLAPDAHLLLLTAHHAVCDGWSWWVMVRELAALYGEQASASAAVMPAAESFADYALQEALGPRDQQAVADERYWTGVFADGAPVMDLPLDHARPARRSFSSARVDFTIDAAIVDALRKAGARRGASLFATLLGGFAATLGRIAGQDDVVVGIPAAGQAVDGHDRLVGHCVNTLPLRFRLDQKKPAAELLDAAQATLLDAIEHQRLTLGAMLRSLDVARDPARLPLVSVLFNIDQALDAASAAFPGLTLEFGSNPRAYENFELFINAVQEHGALRLECQYNRDLFDAGTVRRWLRAYVELLRGLTAAPETALGDLGVVDAEAKAALAALQPEPVDYDRTARIHTLFERQCARTPDAVAVHCDGQTRTYAQLEQQANRIARLLQAQGVHPGALVGLAVERGIDLLACMLGILKSGAGYVPLDPAYPAERLAYMASDAGLAALLTQSQYTNRFDLRGRPVLAIDALQSEFDSLPASPLPASSELPANAVAYVIYTSGSTGRPKGVQVPHGAVVNFLESMRREPGLGPDDVLVAVTTLSFDIAVLELLLPLTVGAQVVIAPRETAIDGVALAQLMHDSGATAMQATPATWRMLIDTGWRGSPRLRAMCGGEPLPPALARSLLQRCGELWNLYGPTETTVWSTCARVLAGQGDAMPDTHIGRPIANTQVWILDERGVLCPEGAPGELCIGGDGVTLGYLYRPELTQARFIPDRYGPHADAKLYRTGDRARWRPDGNLEHQGRIDFQVKIRGFRIELGEVENVLQAHDAVAAAVAVAREDRPGDVRLVAYVEPRPGGAVDVAALDTHLRGTLPDYMIPQHLVVLPALPRLPNGKIDRAGLPVPDASSRAGAEHLAPRTALETKIAEAMAQVLGQPQVGVLDDFFAIGGHSLLAAQLTTRLNQTLGATLSLRSLFDAPTVEKLALLIGEDRGAASAAAAPRIQRRADQSRAPLSKVQERLRLMEEFNPGTLSYNTPSAHRLRGSLDVELLDRAIRQLAARQTVLRTAIVIENDQPVQRIEDDINTGVHEVIDLSQLPRAEREAELARHMRALIDQPFDGLAQAPLFRARLYKLAEQEHALFFMPHHIVWDGWSFDLLYQDLSELYAALSEGREPVLPELPVTYGDYAAWHNAWLEGPEYAGQVAFWRERLGRENSQGGRPVALPTDMPRKRGMSGTSRSLDVALPDALTAAVRNAARELDVTVFVLLLAAYYATLAKTSGQRDLVVGTPVRGRNTAESEQLMGYFTNLLPLRLEVDLAAPFFELAREVRGVVLDSFAAPDIRLEDLTRELRLRSEGGGSMLYQALFSFQDVRHRGARWGTLHHSRIEVFQPGATEDLGLWFIESANGLSGGLIYNADILHEQSVLTLRSRYIQLLEAIAFDPQASIATLLARSGVAVLPHAPA